MNGGEPIRGLIRRDLLNTLKGLGFREIRGADLALTNEPIRPAAILYTGEESYDYPAKVGVVTDLLFVLHLLLESGDGDPDSEADRWIAEVTKLLLRDPSRNGYAYQTLITSSLAIPPDSQSPLFVIEMMLVVKYLTKFGDPYLKPTE